MALLAEAPHFDAPRPRPVLQTVEQSPQLPQSPRYPALRFYPNGLIDLEPTNGKSLGDSYIRGLEYEELGMKVVDQMLMDSHFAIGAHLLDAELYVLT